VPADHRGCRGGGGARALPVRRHLAATAGVQPGQQQRRSFPVQSGAGGGGRERGPGPGAAQPAPRPAAQCGDPPGQRSADGARPQHLRLRQRPAALLGHHQRGWCGEQGQLRPADSGGGAATGVSLQGFTALPASGSEAQLKTKLLREALADGQRQAQTTASALGLKTVRLLLIDQRSGSGPRPMPMLAARSFNPEEAPPPERLVSLGLDYCLF